MENTFILKFELSDKFLQEELLKGKRLEKNRELQINFEDLYEWEKKLIINNSSINYDNRIIKINYDIQATSYEGLLKQLNNINKAKLTLTITLILYSLFISVYLLIKTNESILLVVLLLLTFTLLLKIKKYLNIFMYIGLLLILILTVYALIRLVILL